MVASVCDPGALLKGSPALVAVKGVGESPQLTKRRAFGRDVGCAEMFVGHGAHTAGWLCGLTFELTGPRRQAP